MLLEAAVVFTSFCTVCYSATFAVHLSPSLSLGPQVLASSYGLSYIGPVGDLQGVHLFAVSLTPSVSNMSSFASNPGVLSVFEQVPLLRSTRYSPPTDPNWTDQWALHNVGQVGEKFQRRDLNVESAWLQGLTGEGVVIGVVDDGVMYTHEDLKENFISAYSADVADMDDDVYPGTDATGQLHRHGTSCAGVLVMAKDNDICGVGVAYNSKVAGIRLLSGTHHSDATEAIALGLNSQHIDIYSNSWGPYDDGIVVDGPGHLALAALEQGVRKGRRGKGSIYVWAAGNGGHTKDFCSTDGYASSIFTIAVGSVDQRGQRAFYDEMCPSKMVVAFHYHKRLSRGSHKRQAITSNVNGMCRHDFLGTSVACPLVSGAIALALQANGGLTWRDVQYLLAYTARRDGLGSPQQWRTNGGGLLVSEEYGFGAVDAEALVSRARHWRTVPPQQSCSLHHLLNGQRLVAGGNNSPTFLYSFLTAGRSLHLLFNVSNVNCAVSFLEHVVLRVKLVLGGAYHHYGYSDYISHSDKRMLIQHKDVRRGDVTIDLVSPFGTTSQLLPHRPKDFVNNEGFNYWPFMSVRHWGEFPRGEWLVNVSYSPKAHGRGYVLMQSLELNLFGTSEVPESILAIPGTCDGHCASGCGGKGPFTCDVCKSKRNAKTLQCVDTCSDGDKVQGNYCFPSTNSSHTPPSMIVATDPMHTRVNRLQTSNPGQSFNAAASHSCPPSIVTSLTVALCALTVNTISRIDVILKLKQ